MYLWSPDYKPKHADAVLRFGLGAVGLAFVPFLQSVGRKLWVVGVPAVRAILPTTLPATYKSRVFIGRHR